MEHGLMVAQEGSEPNVAAEFTIFKTLTPEQFRSYRDSWNRLNRARRGGLIVYVRQSIDYLNDAQRQIRQAMMQTRSAPAISANSSVWGPSVQFLVLTYCSSLHLYCEQVMAQAKTVHGKDSAAYYEIRDRFSECFDTSFAYRLAIRLRNVLIHHSLDCVRLRLNSSEQRSPGGIILHVHTVKAPLDRDIFLSAKKSVSARLRDELREQPEDPDLFELCRNAHVALESAHDSISHLIFPTIKADAKVVCELDEEFGDRQGDRALVDIPPDSLTRGSWKLPHTPLRAAGFKFARRIIEQSNE